MAGVGAAAAAAAARHPYSDAFTPLPSANTQATDVILTCVACSGPSSPRSGRSGSRQEKSFFVKRLVAREIATRTHERWLPRGEGRHNPGLLFRGWNNRELWVLVNIFEVFNVEKCERQLPGNYLIALAGFDSRRLDLATSRAFRQRSG